MVSTPPTVSLVSFTPLTRSRSIELGSLPCGGRPARPEGAPRKAATCLILPVPALMHRPETPPAAERGSTPAGANAAAPARRQHAVSQVVFQNCNSELHLSILIRSITDLGPHPRRTQRRLSEGRPSCVLAEATCTRP